MRRKLPNSWIPQQFENAANPEIHKTNHGRRNLGGYRWQGGYPGVRRGHGRHDHWLLRSNQAAQGFVPGHRGGTEGFTGDFADPRRPAAEARPHKIQGTGAGFVPKNLHLKDEKGNAQITECVQVSNDDAFAMARRLAKEEGILVGISTGANVWAAIELAKKPENKGKTIVTIACSTGERYLSTPLAAEARAQVGG